MAPDIGAASPKDLLAEVRVRRAGRAAHGSPPCGPSWEIPDSGTTKQALGVGERASEFSLADERGARSSGPRLWRGDQWW